MPTYACPRCFRPLSREAAFCPRCGLRANPRADGRPLDVSIANRPYRVLDRIAVGSRSAVYRCQLGPHASAGEGTFKLARDPVSNPALAREAEALRHLHRADPQGQFTPFLPAVVEAFGYVGSPAEPPRHANVLRFHPDVRSPADDLYTLTDVRAAHPNGLDARDMAWIWRRLLVVLGFAHTHGVTHRAVIPPHVLIDPADHKLFLIGWSSATLPGQTPLAGPLLVPAAYRSWVAAHDPSRAADVRTAARCMVDLLGGNGSADVPPSCDPAIARHLDRCAHVTGAGFHPWHLRAEFDDLIAAVWGPRQFRPLTMPPKPHSV